MNDLHILLDIKVVAAANLLVCLALMWACICRLNSSISKHNLTLRVRYTIVLVGSAACGFQPLLFKQWATLGTLALASAVLASMLLEALHWNDSHDSNVHEAQQ